MVEAGIYDALLREVCDQIEAHGLKVKEAEAAIIDATLIKSAARPARYIETPPQDRAEDEYKVGDATTHMVYSADEEARWITKGRKSLLGYKGFA